MLTSEVVSTLWRFLLGSDRFTLSDLSKLGHQQTGLWVVASAPEVDSNADRPDDSACLARSDATAAVGVSVPLEPGMPKDSSSLSGTR